jgi:hypothetical protein
MVKRRDGTTTLSMLRTDDASAFEGAGSVRPLSPGIIDR